MSNIFSLKKLKKSKNLAIKAFRWTPGSDGLDSEWIGLGWIVSKLDQVGTGLGTSWDRWSGFLHKFFGFLSVNESLSGVPFIYILGHCVSCFAFLCSVYLMHSVVLSCIWVTEGWSVNGALSCSSMVSFVCRFTVYKTKYRTWKLNISIINLSSILDFNDGLSKRKTLQNNLNLLSIFIYQIHRAKILNSHKFWPLHITY